MIQRLQIARVKRDSAVQARDGLNWDAINEYAERMRAGDVFPPAVAFFDGQTYWLADGWHRLEAWHKAGFYEIDVDVRDGTKRDAMLYAVGQNAAHGLRRTNADKHRAVQMMLEDEEWRKWSDAEIARRCAVSDTMVHEVRKERPEFAAQTRIAPLKGGSTRTFDTTKGWKTRRASAPPPTPPPFSSAAPAMSPAPTMSRDIPRSNGHRPLEAITIPVKDVDGAARIIAQYMDVTALIDALARLQVPA